MHALVALDDSDASWDAAAFAGALLRESDTVTVINVVSSLEPVQVSAGGLVGLPAATAERVDSAHDDVLNQLRPAIAAANADDVVIEEGDVADRICAVAANLDVDLIIAGTRDRSAILRFLTGSVSHTLVDNAPCSVLVVR